MPLARYFPHIVAATRRWSAPWRYAGAAGVAVAALGMRFTILEPFLPHGVPFLTFFLGTLIASSLFRRGPAILNVILSAGLSAYFLLPPTHSLIVADRRDVTALCMFVTIAGLMIDAISGLQDMVERLETNERVRANLLREFRHRTRNDLASLVSLLRLRARTASPECRQSLVAASEHALALSRVHTRLVTASPGAFGDEPVIHTRAFLAGLVADVAAAKGHNGAQSVSMTCEAEDYLLSTERSVPLGLLVQELVGAALRLGFPSEDHAGTIAVAFIARDGHFILTVADDGVSLPDSGTRGQGLEPRLLRGMAAQLRGTFTAAVGPRGTGAVGTVRFPMAAPTMLPMPSGPPPA